MFLIYFLVNNFEEKSDIILLEVTEGDIQNPSSKLLHAIILNIIIICAWWNLHFESLPDILSPVHHLLWHLALGEDAHDPAELCPVLHQ